MWVKNWRFGKLFLYLWLELIVCQYVNRKKKKNKKRYYRSWNRRSQNLWRYMDGDVWARRFSSGRLSTTNLRSNIRDCKTPTNKNNSKSFTNH